MNRLLTGYHVELRLRSRGSVLCVGIWVLMCVVLANGYAGVLFSFLTVTKLQPIINSIEELAVSDVQLLIQQDTELTGGYLVTQKYKFNSSFKTLTFYINDRMQRVELVN